MRRSALRRVLRIALVSGATVLLVIALYVLNIVLGMHAAARTEGTLAGLGVQYPVQILRDARDVPHIRAQNEHDLFFAQGYVEASDRLFQLDLLRRYVYGELAEVLGKPLVDTDAESRVVPVHELVERQWQRLDTHERDILTAFADGVNAAMQREPMPVEFRVLLYKPQPWKPQDSLAVGFATVIDLTDTWNDIAARSWRHYQLTDPCFDAPVTEGLAHIADPAHCSKASIIAGLLDTRAPIGSNEWASGAAHTTTGRALLANDPHLRLQIPGVWYLADLAAPTYHAAGAVLAGTPGIILGHNDRIAWGATNGSVSSLSVFDAPKHLDPKNWQIETIHVRFGNDVQRRFYRGPREFGATVRTASGSRFVLVRWSAYEDPQSPVPTFDALDRARSVEGGIAALARYPGPTQNFVLADTTGRAAYHLAGTIPNDPTWSRSIHPARDLPQHYGALSFGELPHVDPSRDAVVWTANNKMYGPTYPWRLSPEFTPPYRAHRIAELLRARSRYDVSYFASMQMDTYSVGEAQLAKMLVASSVGRLPAPQMMDIRLLSQWNGDFSPRSSAATIAFNARQELIRSTNMGFGSALIDARRSRFMPAVLLATSDHPEPWGAAGAVTVKHPLAALGLGFLNGTTFAGDGDAFTIHVQNTGFSQSFRAVWDVGNWDAGGITIPQGESGEPGSGHYTDESSDWTSGRLVPMPFSPAAVAAAARAHLTLEP